MSGIEQTFRGWAAEGGDDKWQKKKCGNGVACAAILVTNLQEYKKCRCVRTRGDPQFTCTNQGNSHARLGAIKM